MANSAPILTSDQLNALAKQTGYNPTGGGFSSVGLPPTSAPQTQTSPIQNQTTALQSPSQVSPPTGWDNQTYANFKQANTTLEPNAQDTQKMQGTGTNPADQYLQNYLKTLTPTESELGYQSQLNNLQNEQKMLGVGEQQANLNVDTTPIALEFQTGQKAALARQYGVQNQTNAVNQQTVTQKLALEQSKRQSAADVTKAQLEYNKPITVSYGGGVYSPASGQIVAGNNPASDPLISTAIQNGQLTPDMLTRYGAGAVLSTLQSDPTFNFVTGQASKAGQLSAATTGAAYKFNPITGLSEQQNPTAANNPPVLGTPSSGSGAYQAGQLTKLLQSQGKTADDATLQGLWKQYGNGGAYSNDTAHNSQIYNALNGGQGSGGNQTINPQTQNQSQAPNSFPIPQTKQQAEWVNAASDPNGSFAKTINAQNTAIGHLTYALDIAKQMQNFNAQPANAGKNWFETQAGKTAVNNYNQSHQLSSSELDSAYGIGSAGERELTAAIGNSKSSPEQLMGFAQTGGALLSSKVLSNIQGYKTAMGQNAPLNLNWFVAPDKQQALANIGIQFHVKGNDVAAYQAQPDGSYKKIQ